MCMHNTYEILCYAQYVCWHIKRFTADLVAETILLFIVVCPQTLKTKLSIIKILIYKIYWKRLPFVYDAIACYPNSQFQVT